ncbi:MAG: Fic family protein [Candidatus Neomarinimicrobiota bacterium]
MAQTRKTGDYISSSTVGEEVRAFVPYPLPPQPAIILNDRLSDLMEKANRALGRLDGLAAILPNISLFLRYFIRKEAVLSSQIENTQSTMSDLILFELDERHGGDAQDVISYLRAMNYGLDSLRNDFPLSLRLIREIHGELLTSGLGSDKTPGEFRRSQNWIGGTRPGNATFVPPPPDRVMECMGHLENFLHSGTPVLMKAALAHVQFETIHPFLDGNGRLGRLLITFLLCAEEALSQPLLYLSLFLKANRDTYYQLLQEVRTTGNWEDWLEFFFRGVKETADQATHTAKTILTLFEEDQVKILSLGRAAGSVQRLHTYMERNPIFTVGFTTHQLDQTPTTTRAALKRLMKLGIVGPSFKIGRNQYYAYTAYLALLSEGTEL